jgi:hypothetical protein
MSNPAAQQAHKKGSLVLPVPTRHNLNDMFRGACTTCSKVTFRQKADADTKCHAKQPSMKNNAMHCFLSRQALQV